MKQLLKKCLRLCLKSDLLWLLAHRFRIPGAVAARRKVIAKRLACRFQDKATVLSGPFKGLVYPTLNSAGSALIPKLLGSYESELHSTLFALTDVAFSTVVDIGCAEGYYAVGFSRLYPTTRIIAYDIAEKARNLCREMAKENRAENVEIREFCDRNELMRLPPSGKHLIISDCEGYEKKLFDVEVVKHLSSSYFIIELHDSKTPGVSRMLYTLFARTHDVELIGTEEAEEKSKRYEFSVLQGCDPFEKAVAFAENRGETMHWLIAVPTCVLVEAR
jgi:predicted RNA methylase